MKSANTLIKATITERCICMHEIISYGLKLLIIIINLCFCICISQRSVD